MRLVPSFGAPALASFFPEREAPVTIRVIDSRTELSVKFVTISHIGYQIQIAHLKICQGSSFRAPRILRFVAEDGIVPFRCRPISSRPIPLKMEASVSVVIDNIRNWRRYTNQPGTLRWFGMTHELVVKVISVSEQQPMRQLTLRMPVALCDGLFDDLSVDGVTSLITM
ncbi:hypothetical protein TNCV_58341 [Trichonephila clavipes]|nr:hypothetical protein TNCV_58341 [Trichonephila clavipes]